MKHLSVDLTTAVATSRIEEWRCQADRRRLSARARRAARLRRPGTRSHPGPTGE